MDFLSFSQDFACLSSFKSGCKHQNVCTVAQKKIPFLSITQTIKTSIKSCAIKGERLNYSPQLD